MGAQECCKDSSSKLSLSSLESIFGSGKSDILCPGQPKENYCDCDGDCTEKPEWCQCADAQECCKDTSSKLSLSSLESIFSNGKSDVLCPGQPEENYCDCTADCTEKPEWCQCADAQKCCNEYSLRVALGVVSAAFFLAGFLFLLN